jgi:two-component system nitrate/nitrite response regulator NarL
MRHTTYVLALTHCADVQPLTIGVRGATIVSSNMDRPAPTTRVLIGSSSSVLRAALARHIGEHDAFDLVEAVDDEEILPALAALAPDIALLGPFKPGRGREAEVLSYARGRVRVVFMSAEPEPALYDAIALGAMGYLTLHATADETFEILEAVAVGQSRFSRVVQDALALEIRERGQTMRPVLTQKEQDVLRLMAQGLNSVEIGKRLFLTKSTVKTHQHSLYKKLEVHGRGHAVAVGVRHRLI